MSALDPGQKIKIAFSLSVEAGKMPIAGLRAQGFTESEIHATVRARHV